MIGFLLAIIYLAFISLGLPDSLLGAGWPSMYEKLNVPVSYAGIISIIITIGTIISSLLSDKLTRKFKPGLVTAASVLTTAIALFGFSISNKFYMLILFAIPYGLGAGGVDATLNNYVALHFKSKHMSWLHCMWGVGASISPYIMSYALTSGSGWNQGYLIVSIIQIVISFLLFISLPLWNKKKVENETNKEVISTSLSFKEIFKIPGAIACFITFFCYCALEQTAMLWASSYLVLNNNIDETLAASLASLLFLGLTLGRAINGFLTIKFADKTLIRIGSIIICLGIIFLFIPISNSFTIIGFTLVGLGCAPIYPCIIHMTPTLFGKDKSQVMIGIQMASAYIGCLIMPPLFGLIANHISPSLLPIYLSIILIIMVIMHEIIVKSTNTMVEK